jgi:hypothetical protein
MIIKYVIAVMAKPPNNALMYVALFSKLKE